MLRTLMPSWPLSLIGLTLSSCLRSTSILWVPRMRPRSSGSFAPTELEPIAGCWLIEAPGICGEAAVSAVHDGDVPAHIVVNVDKPSLLASI